MDRFDINQALADRRIVTLFTDMRPWWLWSVTGDRAFMANPAAAREMGAVGRAITAERLYSPRHPFAALLIEELQKFTGSAHFFTFTTKNNTQIDYVMNKLVFDNKHEALLIRAVEPKADINALIAMVDAIDTPILLFDAAGVPNYANYAGENLGGHTLPELLGEAGTPSLLRIAALGAIKFSLSTGTLHLTKLADLGQILGAITPALLPAEVELPFIEEMSLSIENDEMSIEGTMPSPFLDKIDVKAQKLTRFIWSLDDNYVFTSVSQELASIIGHNNANIEGKGLEQLLKSQIIDKEGSFLNALVLRETKSGHSTLWNVEGGKHQARIDLAALPVFDRQKGFTGYRGFGLLREYIALENAKPEQKLSDQKLSDEEIKNFNTVGSVLKAATPKPKKSTDKAPHVIYFGNKILHVNDLFLKLSGFSSLEAFEASGGTARLFAGNHVNENNRELALTHKDGRDLPVAIRLTKTTYEGQSALKMSFELMAEKPATKQLSIQNFAFPSLIIDEKGKIEAVNNAFATVLTSDETTMIGKAFAQMVAPESHAQAEDYITSLLKNGVRSVINEGREILFHTGNKQIKPLFTRLSMIDGNRIMAQFFDPTDIPAKEPETSKQIAELAHEIRTPLNAIIGFSESMMEQRFGAISPPAYLDYINDIHAAGLHLLSVVNALNSNQNTAPLNFEVNDINTLIEESLILMSDEANHAKVIIRKALTRPMPQVLTDKRALKQILLNLLGNAVKYTPQGGQIIVSSLLNEAGEAVIRVRDTGDGLDNAGSHENSGSGLGLPIIKSLSEANRTRFSLTSRAGQGTLAEVTFPQERIL